MIKPDSSLNSPMYRGPPESPWESVQNRWCWSTHQKITTVVTFFNISFFLYVKLCWKNVSLPCTVKNGFKIAVGSTNNMESWSKKLQKSLFQTFSAKRRVFMRHYIETTHIDQAKIQLFLYLTANLFLFFKNTFPKKSAFLGKLI